MPRIDIARIPAQQIASYPKEFAAVISGREKQRIGDPDVDFLMERDATGRRYFRKSGEPIDG